MRICLINSFMWKMRGAELFCRDMIKGLSPTHDGELFIVCEKMPERFNNEIKNYNVNVVETGFSGINSGKLTAAIGWILLPEFSRKIVDVLAKIKPDIINPHHFADVFYATHYKARKDKDVRIPWFCHEPSRQLYDLDVLESEPLSEQLFFKFYRSMFVAIDIKYVRLFVDYIASNSKYTAELVEGIYGKQSQVIYPGIDTSRFRPIKTDLKDVLNCDFLILSVGNIDFAGKNVQIIPMLLSKLRKWYDVKWVHIGRGKDESRFVNLAKSYDVLDSLKVIDYVTETKLIEYYSSADVVVYTSVREPFGLVPIEAMACETPVVASKYGGTSETVVDKRTGLLVNMTSLSEVSRTISYLLKNNHVAKKMGATGRERVCKYFNIEKTIKDFEFFLSEMNKPHV